MSTSLRSGEACGKRVATIHIPCSRCSPSRALASASFIRVGPFGSAGTRSHALVGETARDDRRHHMARQFVAQKRRVVTLALQHARLDAPVRARIENAKIGHGTYFDAP